MSVKQITSALVGVGLGSGVATFFWGKGASDDRGSVKISAPVHERNSSLGHGGKPDGVIQLKGSNINPAEFFKYGFPGPVHDLESREEFVSCYDRRTRNPYWVVEHITPDSLSGRNADRKNSMFMEDEQIPEKFRAKLRDYFRSGYDRGHQAPAANAKFSQKAMDETFYLTNMCPQVGDGFNRDYWAHLEYFCRRLTDKYNSVRIVTGPLYLPKKDPIDGKFRVTYEVIGNPPSVAVPTHFFKVIVAESPIGKGTSDEIAVGAFVLPNSPISNETKLIDFEVPVDAVERSSGLQLLNKFPESKKKALCKEVDCQIVVREFTKALPSPKQYPALPGPKN
ncbi:LAFE_0G03246g1_1 [Lachancea fermentati]|uniref:Endonuclease n=1 Tax=Lachancea fermentati TaxID=4955 RepID=A0A1G4MGS5_LACFM|nr:LAFE_0G03246g1_1 [Lachancea fermentati]